MDSNMYLVVAYWEDKDCDSCPDHVYIGIAMTEKRAKEIMDSYTPEDNWIRDKDSAYEWHCSYPGGYGFHWLCMSTVPVL